jgi:hypothetical protein
MKICIKCGWEVEEDSGLLKDKMNGYVCDFAGITPLPHQTTLERSFAFVA